MSEERIQCKQCDAMILPATAAKTGGLCMPCKNGTRQQLAESKAFQEQQKAYLQSPERKHWEWLVAQDEVEGGFQALSLQNQRYFAASLLSGELFNGGFHQYFHNTASDYYLVAVDALREMGATRTLELVFAAKELAYGDAEVPVDRDLRQKRFGKGRKRIVTAALEEIDQLFYGSEHDKDLASRFDGYAEQHRLHQGF